MTDIMTPTLGESVAEATVARWSKKQGDTVKRDEVLVELETDKVSLEVVAPEDVDGIRAALVDLHARWRDGRLDAPPLSDEWREKLSRASRVEELADLLRSLA